MIDPVSLVRGVELGSSVAHATRGLLLGDSALDRRWSNRATP
jgi:hypothetical protein